MSCHVKGYPRKTSNFLPYRADKKNCARGLGMLLPAHETDRGAKAASVKRIRIPDLRHSHVSLLIEALEERIGAVLEELQGLDTGGRPSIETQEKIELMTNMMKDMKNGD